MLSLLDALPISRVQRNAEAGRGILECDQLALGMARVEFGARVVVPERLGDVVDEIVGLLGARHPLGGNRDGGSVADVRSEEHTSELQSLMRISYAVFCLKKKKNKQDKVI